MSSSITFYITKSSLEDKRTQIELDHWAKPYDILELEKLYTLLDEEPDLKFKDFQLVIVWVEFRSECEKFEAILDKYKIEYQKVWD